MTEYQKAQRKEAHKRNLIKRRKETNDNTLRMCADGVMRMRKDIKAKEKYEMRKAKLTVMHKTNVWQFTDSRKPATLCGRMYVDGIKRTSSNGEVTCTNCMKRLKKNWYGQPT